MKIDISNLDELLSSEDISFVHMGLNILEEIFLQFNEIEAIIGEPSVENRAITAGTIGIPKDIEKYPHARTICLWYYGRKQLSIRTLTLDDTLSIEHIPQNLILENHPDLTELTIATSQDSERLKERLSSFNWKKIDVVPGTDLVFLINSTNSLEDFQLRDNSGLSDYPNRTISIDPSSNVGSSVFPDVFFQCQNLKYICGWKGANAGSARRVANSFTERYVSFSEEEAIKLSQFSQLKKAFLRIETLSEKIKFSENLLHLKLLYEVGDLSTSLATNSKLEYLYLESPVTEFPLVLLKLEKLQNLELKMKGLETLPAELLELPSLKHFRFLFDMPFKYHKQQDAYMISIPSCYFDSNLVKWEYSFLKQKNSKLWKKREAYLERKAKQKSKDAFALSIEQYREIAEVIFVNSKARGVSYDSTSNTLTTKEFYSSVLRSDFPKVHVIKTYRSNLEVLRALNHFPNLQSLNISEFHVCQSPLLLSDFVSKPPPSLKELHYKMDASFYEKRTRLDTMETLSRLEGPITLELPSVMIHNSEEIEELADILGRFHQLRSCKIDFSFYKRISNFAPLYSLLKQTPEGLKPIVEAELKPYHSDTSNKVKRAAFAERKKQFHNQKKLGRLVYLEKASNEEIDSITELNLSGIELVTIPDIVFQCFNLESLNLSENKLFDIPAEIATLKKLKKLNLSNNRIVSLSPGIRYCSLVEELDISSNNFLEVPAEISSVTKLKTLNLSNNRIKNISQELSACSLIEKLNLSNTAIALEQLYFLLELPDLQEYQLSGTSVNVPKTSDTKDAIKRALAIVFARLSKEKNRSLLLEEIYKKNQGIKKEVKLVTQRSLDQAMKKLFGKKDLPADILSKFKEIIENKRYSHLVTMPNFEEEVIPLMAKKYCHSKHQSLLLFLFHNYLYHDTIETQALSFGVKGFQFPVSTFKQSPNLKEVSIKNSQVLGTWDGAVFPKLETLELQDTTIEDIGTLLSLPNLKNLKITGEMLSIFAEHDLKKIESLEIKGDFNLSTKKIIAVFSLFDNCDVRKSLIIISK